MRRGSGSEDESVQGNPVVVAPESQGNERFGDLTPERRLEELRAEMEKLSQVISGKVQKLEIESPVLETQGEIATMEGVITQAVAKSGDDEGPQGSRASPGETQAAGKKETSASEGCREKEQAGPTLQITGAGQDGIVERHRERSCFVRVPIGPRNLVQHSLAAAAEEILRVSRKRLWRSENREVRPRARVTF
ncbi:hypothetical protein HPB52_007628 [Rhipicephalus sanguineus]|uniref:Uncharacterized protein n=1 Tax=Rhipicephalus sanguineus TaxID=34632 RepID=A0A9D4PR16_RHISA|nr:hypothetical protein HPB52_007628 [Rhipicephalus sanguineus]